MRVLVVHAHPVETELQPDAVQHRRRRARRGRPRGRRLQPLRRRFDAVLSRESGSNTTSAGEHPPAIKPYVGGCAPPTPSSSSPRCGTTGYRAASSRGCSTASTSPASASSSSAAKPPTRRQIVPNLSRTSGDRYLPPTVAIAYATHAAWATVHRRLPAAGPARVRPAGAPKYLALLQHRQLHPGLFREAAIAQMRPDHAAVLNAVTPAGIRPPLRARSACRQNPWGGGTAPATHAPRS